MVAPNGRWVVVEVPVYRGRGSLNARPKDLLPWADPYIASLVQRLKAEILAERAERAADPCFRNRLPLADDFGVVSDELNDELSPPLPSQDPEFDFPDRDAWPNPGEIL